MIELLKLNRKSRNQVRRIRIIRHEIHNLVQECDLRTRNLVAAWKDGRVSPADAMVEVERLQSVHSRLLKLLG